MTTRSLMEGQFADAERLTAEVLELGAWAEVPDALTYTSFELAVLRWEQGRLGETEELLRDLISRRGQGPVWHSFLALLLTEAGRAEEAREELDAAGERAAARGGLAAPAIAAIAVAALGDRERAAKLHRELLPGAGGIVVGGAGAAYLGPVSHHLGVLATLGGRAAEAVEQLTEAVAVNERAGALPWLARSRFELAASAGRARERGRLGAGRRPAGRRQPHCRGARNGIAAAPDRRRGGPPESAPLAAGLREQRGLSAPRRPHPESPAICGLPCPGPCANTAPAPPPAIAGRMTIVSSSETGVSRPSSTRTSSSLR